MGVSKFDKFVKDVGGINALAKKLTYHPSSVQRWVFGFGSPKSTTIAAIIKLSKGKLTFDDIIKHSTRNMHK